MSGFAVKGRCPDAWHPMMAGDGLLVRVRPRLGRLTRAQMLGLCDAATRYGSGLIDVTRRANLQIRGIRENSWPALIARLSDLDLIDPDPAREARRNILVAPEWRAGDDTVRIANLLAERCGALPDLPAKVGFAIDAGPAPVLGDVAADFRIERSDRGGLMIRADGRRTGAPVVSGREVEALIALAHWFVETGGALAGRMARHARSLPPWAEGDLRPAPAAARTQPGGHAMGAAYGLAFGQIEARTCAQLLSIGPVEGIRITPWRVVILEGADPQDIPGILIDPAADILRVDACPGRPLCPQASVDTRSLARRLAPHVTGALHVSGCAKGCARTQGADTTLIGRDGRFDLVRHGRASDPPIRFGLDQAEILDLFGAA